MTQRSEGVRKLRTVLFTDIVGSTDMAAQLGDRRWRALVGRHHQVIRRELKRHHGREIDTAGDGFFATFERPTDALRCAAASVASVHGIGLRIRAGLHTGEVETSGREATGIAVHIGARLLALAGAEEVLVSGTVRDLVAGSGETFEDRGSHELKGVPGEWRVWALVLPPLDESVVATTEEDARASAIGRRRAALTGAAALVLLAILAVAAVIWAQPRADPIVTGADSAVAIAAGDGRTVAGFATGRAPAAVEVVDGSVWVANVGSGTITRLQGDTTSTFGQVGSQPTGLAAATGLVWVADRFSDQVTLLSAIDGSLQEQLTLHAGALAAGHGSMWATDGLRDVVHRLDPGTGAELALIELEPGSGVSDIAVTDDAVWIASSLSEEVSSLEPRTGAAGAPISVPDVERISADGADLWAVSPAVDVATRIDTGTARIAVRADVCDTPVAVATVEREGGAWIACSADQALWHVDHAGTVDRRIALDAVPSDLAIDGDRVWVTLRED
jgi:class 3 adenylate cyclase